MTRPWSSTNCTSHRLPHRHSDLNHQLGRLRLRAVMCISPGDQCWLLSVSDRSLPVPRHQHLYARMQDMDPVVAAGIIGAGAAVVSGLSTGLLLIGSTRMQIKSAAKVARRTFIGEKQAETYVSVCNQISRVQAWA